MSLRKDQVSNKTDVFNEIKRKYPAFRQATRTAADKPRVWREDWFAFQAPQRAFLDNLKDGSQVEVKLTGLPPIQGKFTVVIEGKNTKDQAMSFQVGTIDEATQ